MRLIVLLTALLSSAAWAAPETPVLDHRFPGLVEWTDVEGETRYELSRQRLHHKHGWQDVNTYTFPAGQTSFEGYKTHKRFFYERWRIRACDHANCSAWSDWEVTCNPIDYLCTQ